jgi:hypothetical protein
MAIDELIAPAAMRNTCANADPQSVHPLQMMITRLKAAVALEHTLLRCNGCSGETDQHVRNAEVAWRQVYAYAGVVHRNSAPGLPAYRAASLVRKAVDSRDTGQASRVLQSAMSEIRTLADWSNSPVPRTVLNDAVRLLSWMHSLELDEISPFDAGACPESSDLGLEI